jgi:hypothetical protein
MPICIVTRQTCKHAVAAQWQQQQRSGDSSNINEWYDHLSAYVNEMV